MIVPVIASDITVENSGFSNANIAVTLPDGFVPAAGAVYAVLVKLAVPVSVSGATMTLGGPERYAVISMRRLPWTMCA